MAFTPLIFSKSWENSEDFPTYEPDEARVRADLQYLYDEIRDAFNGLVAVLNDTAAAANLPVEVEGLKAETLQEALEETLAQIQNAAAGQIVNGSITREKLAEALLRRVYGGRVLVSWETPGPDHNEESDCPVGQLWLRPALTVSNRAGTSWTCSGCTAEGQNGSWTFTADQTMAAASASQRCDFLGQPGQRVLVHLKPAGQDASLTELTVYLGGTAVTVPESGWLETAVDSGGGLDIQFSARWPSAQAAGYFQMEDLTVVDVGALEAAFPQCAPPESWTALLESRLPFATVFQPRALFLEIADGVWETVDFETLPVSRGGTGLDAVAPGRLLYGGSTSLETLDPPEENGAVLRFLDGAPHWSGAEAVVADLGILRTAAGTYTGNKTARTIQLPVTPKLLALQCDGEEMVLLLAGLSIQKDDMCDEMDHEERYPRYTVGLALRNSQLVISLNATQTALQCGATAHYWNENGRVYQYLALY